MTGRKLSNLHPGGFVAVPHALHQHPSTKPGHIAIYYAIVSCARWVGTELIAKDARNRRIAERAGMGLQASRRYVKELEAFGFLRIIERPGYSHRYVVLSTAPEAGAALKADEAADLKLRPDIAAHRGGRPRLGAEKPPHTNPRRGLTGRKQKPPRTNPPGTPTRIRQGPCRESTRLL